MKKRPLFKVDPWSVIEEQFDPRFLHQGESIFAVGNGYLGFRGNFEEGNPVYQNGTYINGFYELRPIHYGEEAYGYAKNDQTMINLTDCKLIKLSVNGETLDLLNHELSDYKRVLDMREGVLKRYLQWRSPSGIEVAIESTRFVSFSRKHLALIRYVVTLLNGDAEVVISSEMESNESNQMNEWDPREAADFYGQVLQSDDHYSSAERLFSGHTTRKSGLSLACSIDHQLVTDSSFYYHSHSSESASQVAYKISGEKGKRIVLTKFMAYYSGTEEEKKSLEKFAHSCLDEAMEVGYERLLKEQQEHLSQFWEKADVKIEGDAASEQGMRFSLFQLVQSVGKSGERGISAKGLTGQGYEGHYFWDTEIYVVPVMIYLAPEIAKNLLIFRHSQLPKARERAATLSQKGALFSWRTISGEEASAYFPAGTAQYHINADIAYAVKKYVEITEDRAFLREYGAEILLETARFWVDLGFFSEQKEGQFCIHEVTGPDEYTALVNNNAYTNLMARENLLYAAQVFREEPSLIERLGVGKQEMEIWQEAADKMYIPYDHERGIIAQDDSFLEKEPWNIEEIPKENFPLLLHYHPLVIYRKQIMKQSDTLLALFLLRKYFSEEEVKKNFDFYDPLTTGDSSLSGCIQGILAAQVGYEERVFRYFEETVEMDLENINHNVRDGVHIASMAGAWLYCLYGFLGLQDDDGVLSFHPKIPKGWQKLSLSLQIKGNRLLIEASHEETNYHLLEGEQLVIFHNDQEIALSKECCLAKLVLH